MDTLMVGSLLMIILIMTTITMRNMVKDEEKGQEKTQKKDDK